MKFADRSRHSREIDITVIPLIDVLLFLLLFFMVTTSFNRQTGLKVDLPHASTQPPSEQERPLEIAIDAGGSYAVDGQALVNKSDTTLHKALKAALDKDQQRGVMIRADGLAPHQAVVSAMDISQKLGVKRLSIATQLPDTPSP